MKNRQGITIAALIIAIIGLSIGFAAFSNTLNISSSASVNPSENTFNVVFSSSNSSVATNSVVPTKNAAATSANITTTNATISGRSLTNLSAEFTAPGQSVTYETNLYVYNAGQLQAQLTGIVFNNATDSDTYKKCAAIEQQNASATATESLVNAACEGISIKVTIGTADDVTPTTTGDKAHLNYQMLGVGASLPAKVTISYDEGASYVDGPMSVSFGRIDINATSAIDPSQEVVPVNPWKVAPINLTSTDVVFDKTYTPVGDLASGLPQSFELDPSSAVMITNDGPMNLLSNNNLANGITVPNSNSIMIDVDAYMGVNYDMCQLFVFDGLGTATVYVTSGAACEYSNLINSSTYSTYSAN